MMRLPSWGRFPSKWVTDGGLAQIKWKEKGSRSIAALRVYLVLAHRFTEDDGIVRVTYDELTDSANLSRQSIADGLDLLINYGLIERVLDRRGAYRFCSYDPSTGWAKVPAQKLYLPKTRQFRPFKNWTMRSLIELDALKLYIFIAAARDRQHNETYTKYTSMEENTGVLTDRIIKGLSLLTLSGMIATTELTRTGFGTARSYRLIGLETRTHAGTTGRGAEFPISEENPFSATV